MNLERTGMKLTKPQFRALLWAKRKYHDNRVPPFAFRDYLSVSKLINAGLIEAWIDYGAPMYRFTKNGLEAIEKLP